MNQEWQPIASHPKDSSQFMVAYEHGGEWIMAVVRHDEQAGYLAIVDGGGAGFVADRDLTHWRQLPEPPVVFGIV